MRVSILHFKLICDVLPDIFFRKWQPGDSISEHDLVLWAEWENAFFNLDDALEYREKLAARPKGKAKPKRKVRAPISVRTVRAAAWQHLRALDKICLTTLGERLKQFAVPEVSLTNMIMPLRDLPGFPHTLVLHLDEGSQGFAMSWLVTFFLRLRFIFMRDPHHREWNDVRGALSDENVWWVILLSTMVFNLAYGPWESGSWWEKLQGSAVGYGQRANWTSPLFSALYESICKDWGMEPSGTKEHRQQVFESSAFGECFSRTGSKVALKRWFSWVDAFKDADNKWHSRLPGLIMFGMSTGLYHDHTEVPLWRMAGDS